MTGKVTRADIAAALSTVPGVTGHAIPPATATAGDAWPVWASTAFLTYTDFETAWDIYLLLPAADLDATVGEADPRVVEVAWALASVGVVTTVGPARIVAERNGNPVPALHFAITTV
jgi:hypothetical protein